MGSVRTRWAAALASVAVLAALAGCDVRTGDPDAPMVRPAATRRPVDDGPFAGLTTTQIRRRIEDAMGSLTSVTMRVSATDHGKKYGIEVLLTDRGECALAVDGAAGTAQGIVAGGSFYLKADAAFWRGGGESLPKAARGLWVRMPAADNPYRDLCDTNRFRTSHAPAGGTWSTGRETTLRGGRALEVVHAMADETDTFWVDESGPPYVLMSVSTGSTPTSVTYSGFDKAARISAPPADRTVDVGDLSPEHSGGGGDFSV